ncbi:MAG: 4-hydroxy-2-oxovalerate aldolase [Actinomycetota bacterium]|nr:4-hydroxy-2-oxovalerate aldolase [Actinomycetota bacterium]
MTKATDQAPQIFECTLRDGSYAVDFAFTADFTAKVVGALAELGFPYIEVGHGVGIGAHTRGIEAAASDLEYARAAASQAGDQKWGMFAIPGMADVEEVEAVIAEGAAFMRVGMDPDRFNEGLRFIEKVRWGGTQVFVNFMKSHALSPDEMAARVRLLEAAGVDGAYLVDSSGGMLPSEIRDRANAMRSASDFLLGFHGHDNLGLATAHALSVADCGFDIIDATLQGLGRSAGNTSSERFIGLMTRLGWQHDYDLISVLKAGQELVRPKIPQAGYSGLDTLSGVYFFHTSFLPQLVEVGERFGVDPHLLMQGHYEMRQTTPDISLDQAAEALGGIARQIDGDPLSPERYFGVPETGSP